MTANPYSDNLRFREYVPEDRQAVIALLERTFGDSVGFTRFESGNPLGESIRMLGFLGERLVAFNLYMPWLIPTPDGPVLTHQAGAAAVEAEVRGKGVYAKLLEAGERVARDRGVGFLLGFPNPAAHGSYLRVGWQDVATMRLWAMRLPAIGFRVSRSEPVSPGSGFSEWRYAAAGMETAATGSRDSQPLSLFFRRVTAFGMPVIKMADVLRADGNRKLADLPRRALTLRGPAIVLIRCPAAPELPRRWFSEIPRSWNTPVVVKPLAGSVDEFGALRNATYMYGDIDAT